jgi:hypothetical protein
MANTVKPKPAKKAAGPRKLAAVGNTREVFSLDELTGGDGFTFELGGEEYALCDLGDIDLNVVAVADTGNLEGILIAIRYGLGDAPDDELARRGEAVDEHARERWQSFERARKSLRQTNTLFEEWVRISGLRQGE